MFLIKNKVQARSVQFQKQVIAAINKIATAIVRMNISDLNYEYLTMLGRKFIGIFGRKTGIGGRVLNPIGSGPIITTVL